jgi:hypothetical protein
MSTTPVSSEDLGEAIGTISTRIDEIGVRL